MWKKIDISCIPKRFFWKKNNYKHIIMHKFWNDQSLNVSFLSLLDLGRQHHTKHGLLLLIHQFILHNKSYFRVVLENWNGIFVVIGFSSSNGTVDSRVFTSVHIGGIKRYWDSSYDSMYYSFQLSGSFVCNKINDKCWIFPPLKSTWGDRASSNCGRFHIV